MWCLRGAEARGADGGMKQLPNICTPPFAVCTLSVHRCLCHKLPAPAVGIESLDIFKNAAWNGSCEAVILSHWHQKTTDFWVSRPCDPRYSESAPAEHWATIVVAALQLHVATSPTVLKSSPSQANNYSLIWSLLFSISTLTLKGLLSLSAHLSLLNPHKHTGTRNCGKGMTKCALS